MNYLPPRITSFVYDHILLLGHLILQLHMPIQLFFFSPIPTQAPINLVPNWVTIVFCILGPCKAYWMSIIHKHLSTWSQTCHGHTQGCLISITPQVWRWCDLAQHHTDSIVPIGENKSDNKEENEVLEPRLVLLRVITLPPATHNNQLQHNNRLTAIFPFTWATGERSSKPGFFYPQKWNHVLIFKPIPFS